MLAAFAAAGLQSGFLRRLAGISGVRRSHQASRGLYGRGAQAKQERQQQSGCSMHQSAYPRSWEDRSNQRHREESH